MAWISRKEAKERGLLRHSEERRIDPTPPPPKVPGLPPHKADNRVYGLEVTRTVTTVTVEKKFFETRRQREDYQRLQKKEARQMTRDWKYFDSRETRTVHEVYREFAENGGEGRAGESGG